MRRFDRRRFRRRRVRIPVEISSQGRMITGYTTDISKNSIGIQMSRVFRPGAEVAINLKTGDAVLEARGKVQWARQVPPQMVRHTRSGVGIVFTSLTDAFREYLEELGLKD